MKVYIKKKESKSATNSSKQFFKVCVECFLYFLVYAIQDSVCAGTKTMSDRASVHRRAVTEQSGAAAI